MPRDGSRIVSLVAVAVASILAGGLLTACGSGAAGGPSGSATSSTTPGSSSTNSHNQQDVTFATQLIELNEQVATMAKIAIAKTDNPQIGQGLEALVRSANERAALGYSWLKAWNQVDAVVAPAPGLLTSDQITDLTVSVGQNFKSALDTAVQYHLDKGVVAISRAELDGGINVDARRVAQGLIETAASELAALRSA